MGPKAVTTLQKLIARLPWRHDEWGEQTQAFLTLSLRTYDTLTPAVEPDHEGRARVGKHLHVRDLAKLLGVWKAQAVVLVHLSRRTNLADAREHLASVLGPEQCERVHFLMDHRTNRQRYEGQELALST